VPFDYVAMRLAVLTEHRLATVEPSEGHRVVAYGALYVRALCVRRAVKASNISNKMVITCVQRLCDNNRMTIILQSMFMVLSHHGRTRATASSPGSLDERRLSF